MASILVVDDEPVYLQHLSLLLTKDGHEVATAETGQSAMEIAQRLKPDILLADWRLKDRPSGLDIAKALQADNPRLMTIIITGYSAFDMETEARDVANLRILEKPFSLDEVLDMIHEVTAATGE